MAELKENSASAYRRGSVLGFTIGEIFLLLSFILLLLFLLRQAEFFESEQEVEDLGRQLDIVTAQYSSFQQSVEVWTELDETQQQAVAQLASSDAFQVAVDLAESEVAADEVAVLLNLAGRRGMRSLVTALDDVDDEIVQRLADVLRIAESPSDLASSFGNAGGVDPFLLTRGVTIARSMQNVDPRVAEEFDGISGEGQVLAFEAGVSIGNSLSIEDWRSLEAIMQRFGWSIESLSAAIEDYDGSGVATDIAGVLQQIGQRDMALGNALEAALGDVLIGRGGDFIDASGTIALSDATLFERGRSDLTLEMRSFLDEICEPWLNTLRSLDFEIREIRVEGHASPGWFGAVDEEDAYLRNLSLSQDRARVVLEYCLEITWGDDIGDWAIDRSVAIGFSSSKPILFENGDVDPDASQRVLLSASPDVSDLMEQIEERVSER